MNQQRIEVREDLRKAMVMLVAWLAVVQAIFDAAARETGVAIVAAVVLFWLGAVVDTGYERQVQLGNDPTHRPAKLKNPVLLGYLTMAVLSLWPAYVLNDGATWIMYGIAAAGCLVAASLLVATKVIPDAFPSG